MKICWKKQHPANPFAVIRYLTHDEIDKEKWDACIRHAFNGNMYAQSWYLNIVHPGWEALVEEDYLRVMPLTGNRKWGVGYLFQPFFTQQLGVFSTGIINSRVINDFVAAIPPKFRFVQIQLNVHNKPVPEDYRLIPNKNYLLDLIPRYPKLAAGYATNTRRNLKKAMRSGLTLMPGLDPKRLVEMFRENKGRQVKHWHETHYNRLLHLMYQAIYRGSGIIYGVYSQQNELCAGAFFLKDARHLIFLFSAVTPGGRQNGAMTFLIDSILHEYAETDRVFDFEGSNNPDLARFYRGFGAQEVSYYTLEINRLNFPLNHLVGRLKSRKE